MMNSTNRLLYKHNHLHYIASFSNEIKIETSTIHQNVQKQKSGRMTLYARRSLHPGGPGWDTLNRPPPEVSPMEPPRYRNTLRLEDLPPFPRMNYSPLLEVM